MSAPTDFTSDELKALIRDAGLRCTESRTTVLAQMVAADSPLSHAELTQVLVPEGYDQATVYRNLTDLTDAGLLNRLDLGDHIWRFEFRSPSDHDEDHPHFMCTDCGTISCLTTVNISFGDEPKQAPVVAEVSEVFLKGRCAKCS